MRNARSIMMLLVAVLGTGCDSGPTNPLESLPGDVRAFLQADSTLGVRTTTRIELRRTDVALFRISYGEPLDCPSGCFYARALVVRAGGRIGWATYPDPAPNSRVFRVQPQDTSSFTPALLAELRNKDASAYLAVAFMLACSPNMADAVRERIRAEKPMLAPAPDLPGCIAAGASQADVEQALRGAIELHLEGLRDAGLPIPVGSRQPRTSKVPHSDR